MPLTAGNRVGHYEILAGIGAGGMGEVYRARDTKLNREVAIKVIPDAFAQDRDRMARFTREGPVLRPSTIRTSRRSMAWRSALVMELVEGHTLAERIAQSAMSVEEATPNIEQLIDALE